MKPPAFQFYPSDFMMGTMAMTAEQVGAYIRLLCVQWDVGFLPNDDAALCRLGGCDGNAMASIRHKFVCEDGKLRNQRLEEEREKQRIYRGKQAKNAAKRWGGNAKPEGSAMPTHMPTHMPNGCSPSPSPISGERERSWVDREVARTMPSEINTPEFLGAWEKWLLYWADKKHASMPQATADSHLEVCRKLGSNQAIIAIENAIHHGYNAPCMPNEKSVRNISAPVISAEPSNTRR